MPTWKRNLFFLCIAQFLTLIGFSAYLPLIPYYVQELGATTYAQAMSLMAIFDSGGAIAMMVAAPVWGGLADHYGRKMMLVRATLAGSVLAFLMGLATSPSQLIVIRIVQGIFCGTVAAANTLVATETPEEHLGKSLGVMQTVQFVAHAVGPLIGGVLADTFGYHAIFPISSVMIAVALVSILAFVREGQVHRSPRRSPTPGSRPTLRQRINGSISRPTFVLLLALAGNSFGVAVLSPVTALYIKSLGNDAARLATLAGAVVSVGALTSSLSALALGTLADKVGQKLVLVCCVAGNAALYIPQALVSTPMQLVALRAIQGVFMGGVIPTANALLARSVSPTRRGTVFGLATSAQAGGRSLGPVLGAAVAGAWGMHSAFYVTAGIFAAMTTVIAALVHGESAAPEVVKEPPTPPLAAEEVKSRA